MHLTHLLLVVPTKTLDPPSKEINQHRIPVLGALLHSFELSCLVRPFLGALPSPKPKFSLSKEEKSLPPLPICKACLGHCIIILQGEIFGEFEVAISISMFS